MAGRRSLITGGAGFIGNHLARRLLRDELPVAVLDNLRRGSREALPAGAAFIEGDIRNYESVLAAMQGVDVVFHLAAQSNVLGAVSDIEYSFAANVQGTFNVLRAAEEAGVKRVVFTSSREVYGEPQSLPVAETAPLTPKNAYGASKAAGELYCRVFNARGLEVAIVRLANVYGPGDRDRVIPIFIGRALRNEPLTLNGGEQLIDFIWIGDVVDVLSKAAFGELLPEPVNIGSGKGTAISDLAARILSLTGSASSVVTVPRNPVEVVHFVADIARARRLLDFVPPEDPLSHLRTMIGEPEPCAS